MPQKHADYITASVPTPYTILGLRLKPYCIAHFRLLVRIGSPFVTGSSALATNDELLTALMVCACSWRDGLTLFSSPSTLKAHIAKWNRAVGRRFWLFSLEHDYEAARALFREYIEEGSLMPKIWNDPGAETVSVGADWDLILKVALMDRMTEEEVMNKYLPLAWFEFHAIHEQKHAKKILYDAADREDDLNAKRLANELFRN